ncbi:TetR/AcrR family transcriptional regulator [Nocardioides speluncae]|uniref:TetR/AcrR family transcriptional regulator n=1 Tax=Nocardioides speluncae TaxID=2670337 RepID=UPI000D69E2FD|nr:TetR/AcrR family transcriptional regulator [Nocardioides speluncae]
MAEIPVPPEFARARRPDQKQARQAHLVSVARALLADMTAARLTLGEVAQHAGLAKSGVLRHVGSLEMLLLDCMYDEHLDWLAELRGAADVPTDGESLARLLAGSLGRRPVLCDLIRTAPTLVGELGQEQAERARGYEEEVRAQLADVVSAFLTLSAKEAGLLVVAVHAVVGTCWAWTRAGDAFQLRFEALATELLKVFLSGLAGVP